MPRRIAVFTKNGANPGYQGARIGADRTAQRLGAATEHYVPLTPDDVDEQIALIDRAIATRPASVLFTPVHETAVNDGIVKVDAMAMGAIGMEAAIRHLDDERVPSEIILPVQIVDRSNCADWGRPFEERPCPTWDAAMAAVVSRRP